MRLRKYLPRAAWAGAALAALIGCQGQPPLLTYEVPEPATLSLLLLGRLAMIRRGRKRP